MSAAAPSRGARPLRGRRRGAPIREKHTGETIRLGDIAIAVTRKDIKHVHLSVHPPGGRVTLVAPTGTRPEVARAYAVSRLGWIREQQTKLRGQARDTPRQFVERESHYVWGRRYLLSVREVEAKPSVRLGHRRITLTVRPGSSRAKREAVMHDWHKRLLHDAVPGLIGKWERKLGVEVAAYFLQRMKTKWGSCNPSSGNIRLNTDLAKKPPQCLEYIVVHELIHLLEPRHNDRFTRLMDRHLPDWRQRRVVLNGAPLGHEDWGY